MTAEAFDAAVREWMTAIETEGRRLFESGVPAEQCLKLAIAIHDARVLGRRQTAAALFPGRTAPGLN